jgi:phosphoheptose isomerase
MSTQDPRHKNQKIEGNSVTEYLRAYSRSVHEVLARISETQLQAAFDLIKDSASRGARIYVAGNGGSSAIADHLCCDWMKGTYVPGMPSLKVHSMTSNVALLTALANDFEYGKSISTQIEMLGEAGDLVVLISSSGNSPNIIEAAKVARQKKMKVLGLSGFSGGELAKIADVSLHVEAHNYGIAEDSHQILMHVLAQFLFKTREK